MAFDASTWGLGAVLYINNAPRFYLADRITRHDELRYRHKAGSHHGQQVWEYLTILVVLKAWDPIIMEEYPAGNFQFVGIRLPPLTSYCARRPSQPPCNL